MDAMTYHLFGLLGFALSLFTLAVSVVAIIKVAGIAIQTEQAESRWASEVARFDDEVDRLDKEETVTIGTANLLADRVRDLEAGVARLYGEVDRQHNSIIVTIGTVNLLVDRVHALEAAVSRLAPAPAVCCRSDASKTAKTDK